MFVAHTVSGDVPDFNRIPFSTAMLLPYIVIIH